MNALSVRGAGKVRAAGAIAVAALALLLASCLLSPGKFVSSLDLRRDGRFTFIYSGEISLLALSKLAQMGADKPFKEEPCRLNEEIERACTPRELAEQRKAWAENRAADAEKRRKDAEQMKVLLGGIDPSSPQAAEEFASRLRRQAGWKSVVAKGDGLFMVEFALSGRLDHDFAFPTVERFPMANSFIQLTRRADGSVRVEAPGFFSGGSGASSFSSLMALGMASEKGGAKSPMSLPDGTFTVTTDGLILANNTDEGPQSDPSGQRLSWTVNVRSQSAPTALVKLN